VADHPPISGLPEIGISSAQGGQARLAWLASLAPQDDGESPIRLRRLLAAQHAQRAGGECADLVLAGSLEGPVLTEAIRSTASSGLIRALSTISVSAISAFTRNLRGRPAQH